MPKDVIRYRLQYIAGDRDITGDFYDDQDATVVRFWEADSCLIEVTRNGDHWMPTGGDGSWLTVADQVFAEPIDALRAYLPADECILVEEAD